MKKLNNIPIYFLTLLNNKDRICNVNNQINYLNNNNITNTHIFYNYSWPKSITQFLMNSCDGLNEGAFSCLTGHYSLMYNFLNNCKDEYIIIFEDDVIIYEEFINLYNNLYDTLNFDRINFHWTTHNNEPLDKNDIYNDYDDFFKVKTTIMWGSVAYIINRKYAYNYINFIDNFCITVADYPDNDMNFRANNNIYYSRKKYVETNFLKSSINIK